MAFRTIRPKNIEPETLAAIERYIAEHWRRAVEGRSAHISNHTTWEKLYEALPRGERRTPWKGASNLTVPLIRIFIDTFIARTLNIIFATRPLYNVEGFNATQRDGVRSWLNLRALTQWKHYRTFNYILTDGSTAGTTLAKTTWHTESQVHIVSNGGDMATEQDVTTYDGPRTSVIHFDDFFVYPVTARNLDDVEVIFHRLRWTRERFERLRADGSALVSQISEDDFKKALGTPSDAPVSRELSMAGVSDSEYEETEVVEVHFRWTLDGRSHKLIALWLPALNKLADLYYCPYHPSIQIFHHYTPWPRKHCFYGYAGPELASALQEEVSQIHNDRRNNSMLANSVQYKRKNGVGVPNPTSEGYPGKVWDLEEMDDLDVLNVGRSLSGDLIPEEEYAFSLAERLFGIGPVMQGMSQGGRDKRGVYNTMGTLGVMAESNQRQDTNIRDAREVLGGIGRTSYMLCREFVGNKGILRLDDLSVLQRGAVLSSFSAPMDTIRFEVNASNAGANAETNKAALYQLAQVMGQYGTTVQQMSMHLANPALNPILRRVLTELVSMYRWIAQRLLNAHNEFEAEEFLPDVIAAVSQFMGPQAVATGNGQSANNNPPLGGGSASPAGANGSTSLEDLLLLPGGTEAGAPSASSQDAEY